MPIGAARKCAEDAQKKTKPEDSDAYTRFEAALRRSNLCLDAVKCYLSGAWTPYIKE
jgi:hypothetical protein